MTDDRNVISAVRRQPPNDRQAPSCGAPPRPCGLIVLGASAGGVAALEYLARHLPADLPAALLVALHLPRRWEGWLPEILDRAGPLPARRACDGEPILPGRFYVASSNTHLQVNRDAIRVIDAAVEDRYCPSVDRLFQSAAAYGSGVAAVVLSGYLNDGTAGLITVKAHGGTTIVQDPADAAHRAMPASALAHAAPHHCVPLVALPPLLSRLAGGTMAMTGETASRSAA